MLVVVFMATPCMMIAKMLRWPRLKSCQRSEAAAGIYGWEDRPYAWMGIWERNMDT